MGLMKLNVLLIVVDTLRKDHLGCYGYRHNTSPNIDRLAKDGAVFTNAYASDVPTIPSFTALLTGQRGISTCIISNKQTEISRQIIPLPHLLSERGITTCAVSSLAAWKPWFSWGFNYYLNPAAGQPGRVQLVTADEINSYAIPWIRQHKKENFFMFLHYWDVHWPYWPPKEFRGLFYKEIDLNDPTVLIRNRGTPNPVMRQWMTQRKRRDHRPIPGPYREDVAYVTDLYDGEIRYVDYHIGEILNTLEEEDIYDRTMVILTADHGEHNARNHMELYEPVINIPFIVRHPEFPACKIEALIQNIDVAPTVLEAFNIPSEIETQLEGRSLFPLLEGKTETGYEEIHTWMVNSRTIRVGTWKYIENFTPLRPPQELYNLEKDPLENNNLVEEEKEMLNQLQRRLKEWMVSELGSKPDPIMFLREMRKREMERKYVTIQDYGRRRVNAPRLRWKYHDSPYKYPVL